MLKGYEHDGRRWMEGSFEGRFFALDEHGERMMLETPLYGFVCYDGTTNDTADLYRGASVGVVKDGKSAFAWLHGDPAVEPWRIHRKTQRAAKIAIPLGDSGADSAQ